VGLEWIEGKDGDAIAADDTYFPVLVSTFFGPTTEVAIETYFAWLHRMQARAAAEGLPVIASVTDSGPAGVPSARVRRIIAELSKVFGDENQKVGLKVKAWVVVESTAIRSVLRVLEWLHGNMDAAHVASCETALEGALADLRAARVATPEGLVPSRWQRPSRLAKKLG
jgi:hypothetical protein